MFVDLLSVVAAAGLLTLGVHLKGWAIRPALPAKVGGERFQETSGQSTCGSPASFRSTTGLKRRNASSGFLGSLCTQAVWGPSQRAIPAIATPGNRKEGMASSKRPWKIAQPLESFSKLCVNKVCLPFQVVCDVGRHWSWPCCVADQASSVTTKETYILHRKLLSDSCKYCRKSNICRICIWGLVGISWLMLQSSRIGLIQNMRW